jgi:hypothetical protein
MRFICPEIDPQAVIKDLYKVSGQYTDILDGALARTFYSYKKGITEYLYSKAMMKKYLSSITEVMTGQTIAEYATYAGITISDNLGVTIEAMDVYFQSAELLKFRTEMWLTIFTDSGLCFYKPERLATSAKISTYEVIERITQENVNYGFFGESGYSLFSSVVQSDTMNIATITDDLKTIIVNTNKAAADVIIITTGADANVFDYVSDNGKIYLVVSKKEENGIYKLFCVKESTDTYTFAGADLTNPNISTGGTALTKATGAEVTAGTDDAKYTTPKAIKDAGIVAVTLPSIASGAEVTTGTDNAKMVTAKAIKDAGIVAVTLPVKATGAEVDAGTDDAKFVTAKAMEDSSYAKTAAIVATKLDDFATPDDNTDLDATTGHHGLLKKLDGSSTNFLRGDGVWGVPGGSPTKYKCYYNGTTYNTVALDPTGTNGSIIRGVFIPYQNSDDTWRLKFNINWNFSTMSGVRTVTIPGVTFKNVSNYYQAFAFSPDGALNITKQRCTPNTGNLVCETASYGSAQYCGLSGDLELESKPTWAD